jgi:hypothetical protein
MAKVPDNWPRPVPIAQTLERYDAALTAFDAATQELRIMGNRPDPAETRLRYQTAGVVGNVRNGADLLRDVHQAAAVVSRNHFAFMQSMPAGTGGAIPEPWQTLLSESSKVYFKHTGQLSACYQAVLFFVRSLQDTFCRWCLIRAEQNWGSPGMSKAIECRRIVEDDPGIWGKRWQTTGIYKDNHAVALILRAALPDYPMWFARWRDVRNRAKTGAPVQGSGRFNGFEAELTINVQNDHPGGLVIGGDDRDAISLATVAEGLEMSTRVANALAGTAGNGK